MKDQYDTFEQRQLASEKAVEDHGDRDGGDAEQDCVPLLRHVIGFVQDDQALDLGCYCEALACRTDQIWLSSCRWQCLSAYLLLPLASPGHRAIRSRS